MTRAVVIGAGPAGIAAAVCLGRRGVEVSVLEAGADAFAALRSLDPSARLLSPTRLSLLPAMRAPQSAPPYFEIAQFVGAAEHYRRSRGIDVETSTEVTSIARVGGGFEVRTSKESRRCTHVIYSGGTISEPVLPAGFEGATCEIPWCHSRDLRAATLRGRDQVLVVGGGNSAVEAIELAARCGAAVNVSLRSRIVSVPRRVLGVDTHYAVWAPEHLPATTPGARRFLSAEPTFELGRVMRATGAERVGAIARYHPRYLELASGKRATPDLIVFATGYRYGAAPLGDLVERDDRGAPVVRRCESTRAPGLYLLGLRFGRTLASHFLRGIARDASYVARQIGARR